MASLEQKLVIRGKQGQTPQPCLMIFSPWYYGHHPTYLRHLIHYWQAHQLEGTLNIVVMPTLLEKHPDIVALTQQPERQTVYIVSMTREEQSRIESAGSGIAQAFVQGQLIAHYAELLKATRGLLMHFDSCQISLVMRRKIPCPVSGIYYRPTFHYSRFSHYHSTWKERVQQFRERLSLTLLSWHPQFKTLFCLDPFAVAPINRRFGSRATAIHLPDPVSLPATTETEINALRTQLGIEPDRQIFLLFGSLAEERKGTRQLLEALVLLDLTLCRKLCILLVGEPFVDRQVLLETWLAPVRQTLPIQVVTQFGYVPESSVPVYFRLADAILAPYQKHVGMSGILLLAAIAQKPVLSSNYGLMGELVQQYQLGVTVNTEDRAAIAQGLSRLLCNPVEKLCDLEQMKQLAQQNSVEQFGETLFQHFYPS
jgi:glycosyltransferase involved in cell wall biosynthesis